ncbi:MAG TPA: metal-dependent hydrolase [Pseudomonadales bacterium]|nr:metal-dependent hydrolase [Pseudomonadales bacterium]
MNAKASFPVRRMDFSFDDVPAHWFDNDPYLTHVFNALSSMFPDGERFFVDSVRALRDQVHDPEFQKQISAFIGQEAMHSKEHLEFNALAKSHGYDLKKLEKWTAKFLSVKRFFGPKMHLAATAALEHFTALLAAHLMQRPELNSTLHPKMQQLWLWHCVEESEHKSVAFDLYRTLYGDDWKAYVDRCFAMLVAFTLIMIAMQVFTVELMREDKQLLNIRSWLKGGWRLWGYKGLFTQMAPEFMMYFRPGFDPKQQDTRELEAFWKSQLALAS